MSRTRLAAIGAAALAALAGLVAYIDGDHDIAPFFVALALAGGIQAAIVRQPFRGGRRAVAWAIAGGWLIAAVWIGALLAWWQAMCACSYPPRSPEETYLGLTATAYHLIGVYGGAALVIASAVTAELRRRAG
ncbi:MAG TPA: hypothetical protein VHK28_04575 [Candidatus Limnocylindria bacterium]|nr:hypothetical protein [Candidatus Limnocylindria bacterium]